MRKKFIKVMLFGTLALLSTSTFVSCKDYDDDIDGLKESVATTNSDLKTKVDALNASISSLQSAQGDLSKAIASAKDDASKAALQAKADAIASSLDSMTKIKTELTALINANTTSIETLNQKAKDAESKLTGIEGKLSAIQQMLVGYNDLVETVGRIQSAMTRIDQVANSLETLSADIKKATEDIARQQTILETQQIAIDKLDANGQKEFESIKAQITSLLKTLNDQKALLDKAATKEEVTAIQNNVNANKTAISDLSTRVGNIEENLNILKSFFYSMITGISFEETLNTNYNVDFTVVKCDNNFVFGKGLTGEISFKKDQLYTVPTSVYIQVSPSTAQIDGSMLDIVRSDGMSLKSYLDINADAYNEPITRASSKGGIWKVTAQLKNDYNKADFAKLIKDGTKSYLFAIATNENKKEVGDDTRIVASPYKLAFTDGGTNYAHLADINATLVNKVAIGDNVPVEIGKAFEVKVKSSNDAKVYACYATLNGNDDQKIVWRSYGVTGYDNVVKGDILTLTVPGANANGKVVSFTLYAIDFAGNAKPVKDFSVICGKQNTNVPSLTTTIVPVTPNASNIYNMPKAVALSANLASTDEDAANLVAASWVVSFKDKDGNDMTGVSATFFKKNLTTQLGNVYLPAADDIKDIAAVKLSNIDLTKIADNGSVTGSIDFKNANGLQVLSVPITLTKTMPAFPSEFSTKTGMMNAGVITVFPTFNGDGTKATFEYSKIFNLIDNSNSTYFAFASKKDQGTKIDFSNSNNIAVDNSFVGSQSTSVDMKVSYNYGLISAGESHLWKPVWGTDFAIKFASIPEESTITLEKAFSIQYPSESKVLKHHSDANGDGYIITKADDKNTDLMKLVVGTYQMKTISLKTVSGSSAVENEYYTPTLNADGSIKFTKKSDSAIVNADVPSKLVITITDVFGNTFDKVLPFTVVKP